MKKSSIIFDLDGTLWDSSKTVFLAWKKILLNNCDKLNITQEDLKKVAGMQLDEISDTLLSNLEKSEREIILEKCLNEENIMIRKIGAVIFEDVITEIKELFKIYDLYIVSNCQSGYIESFLEYYQIEKYFKDFECYGNNKISKADNIALIIKRNKIKKCCYVGDTYSDYVSAKANSIPFIYAEYGFGKVNECNIKINKFKELKEVLKKM